MPENRKTKHSDLFEDDLFKETIEGGRKLQGVVVDIKTGFKELLTETKAFMLANPFKNSSDLKNYTTQVNQAAVAKKALVDLSAEELKLKAAETAANQIAAAEQKERVNAIKNETIARNANAGSIPKLKAEIAKLTAEQNKLNLTTKEGIERNKQIVKEIDAHNAFIDKNSDKVTKNRHNVGAYSEGIQEAAEATGIFGEITEKITGFLVGLNAVFALGTIGKKAGAAADAEATAASEAHTIAIEEETAATEELSLGRKALNLITNPIAVALVAGAAALKVLWDNVHATQAQKDAWEAGEEAAKTAAKNVTVIGVNSLEAAAKTRELVLAEKALEDVEIKKLVLLESLRNEAQTARTEAQQENKTYKEKIALLQVFIDKTTEATNITIEAEAAKAAQIKLGLKDISELEQYGIKLTEKGIEVDAEKAANMITYENLRKNLKRNATREELEDAAKSVANIVKLHADLESELRRTLRMQAGFIEADRKERLALLTDSEKREIELIQNQYDKQIAQENERYKIESALVEVNQKKLGGDDADFKKEQISSEKLHQQKLREIKYDAALKALQNQDKAGQLFLENSTLKRSRWTFRQQTIDENYMYAVKKESLEKETALILQNTKLTEEEKFLIAQEAENKLLKLKADHEKIAREQLIEGIQKTSAVINEDLDKRSQRNQDALDFDIQQRERNITQQTELAARGLNNQLAFENAKIAQDQLAKEKQKDADIKRAKALAYWNAFTEFLKQDPATASLKAVEEIALGSAISGLFFEGAEQVDEAIKNPVFTGRDGYVIRVDGKERIMTGEQNALVGGMSNKDLANLAYDYRTGMLPSIQYSESRSEEIKELKHLNKSFSDNINRLNETIKNKKETSINWDNHGNLIAKEVEDGVMRTIKYMKARPRL